MNKDPYFDEPTQIKIFIYDKKAPQWIGAIAYKDQIISGCTGYAFFVSAYYDGWRQVKDQFPQVSKPIVAYQNWIDISEEIIGLPD